MHIHTYIYIYIHIYIYLDLLKGLQKSIAKQPVIHSPVMADFPVRTLSQNTETNPGIWLNPLKSQKIPMFFNKFPMFSHTIYTLEPTQCCSGQRRVRFCYTFIVDFPSSVSGASFCKNVFHRHKRRFFGSRAQSKSM